MRFVHRFLAALVLIAIGFGGTSSAATADRDARTAVLGRQQIRAELEAALAKGHLTRMDQYRLLLHAKKVLSAEDLDGFERALDRLAARQYLRGARSPCRVANSQAATRPTSLPLQNTANRAIGSGRSATSIRSSIHRRAVRTPPRALSLKRRQRAWASRRCTFKAMKWTAAVATAKNASPGATG